MKKLLAIVLILMTMGLLPTEKPRAELYIFHQFDSSLEESSVKLDYSQEEMFLIEFLEKSSWQQISLLAKKVSNPNNIEDCFLVQLIQEINSHKSSYSYNDYVNCILNILFLKFYKN